MGEAERPEFSAGARYERQAVREYFTRKMKRTQNRDEADLVASMLRWVRTRQARYDKRPGGL
jgi:hypothetical protein